MNKTDVRKYLAEFVGTCVLVLFGCGSAVTANTLFLIQGLNLPLAFTTLTISVAFGLCIVAMAYSIGNVSGCHINPAVSFGMFVAGRMTVKDLICYIIAQFAGGLAGAFILSRLLKGTASLGQNGYGDASVLGINATSAVIVEVILTFVFVLVILCVTSKPEYSGIAGLVIGLTLTLVHILGIPFTGTSVNPARSFGPAVLAGGDALSQLPVFIISPIIGAAIAAFFYTFVIRPFTEPEPEPEEEPEAPEAQEEEPEPEEESEEEKPETETAEIGYDPIEEMQIEQAPEPIAEAEAEVVAEADADADV